MVGVNRSCLRMHASQSLDARSQQFPAAYSSGCGSPAEYLLGRTLMDVKMRYSNDLMRCPVFGSTFKFKSSPSFV